MAESEETMDETKSETVVKGHWTRVAVYTRSRGEVQVDAYQVQGVPALAATPYQKRRDSGW